MLAIAELQAPPEVLQALRDTGRPNGQWLRAKCPYCDPAGQKSRSLAASHRGFGRGRDRPGWVCHRCHAEEDAKRAKRLATMRLRYDPNSARADEQKRLAAAQKIVERSRPITTDDPVDRYLRRRQLTPLTATWPSTLRHAVLRHPQDKRDYPVMVAVVSNIANDLVGVHRTYLTDDGRKADVSPVKLCLGPIGGGAVRLGVESASIVIAEGIESAIGAGMVFGVVPWAALSAGNMARLKIPRFVESVIIAADKDSNEIGDRSATQLRKAIRKLCKTQNRIIDVLIKMPPEGRSDFADFG